MELRRRSRGSVEVVVLSGDVSAMAAGELRESLAELLAAGSCRLVLDLAAVRFIDSSGLSALVKALKTARDRGGSVVLAGLSPTVRSIFQVTRLDRVLEIFPNEDQAVAHFSS